MSKMSFASLHSGLLARKGDARPSIEPPPFPLPRPENRSETRPERRMAAQEAPPEQPLSEPRARTDAVLPDGASAPVGSAPFGRIRPGPKGWAVRDTPPRQPAASRAAPASPTKTPETTRRTTLRLDRRQLRALRLASLVLDRPQQELLAEGLDLRLSELACGDLDKCACFRAILSEVKSE